MSSKELTVGQSSQYVGPYRLEKTLGKGQTGRSLLDQFQVNTEPGSESR